MELDLKDLDRLSDNQLKFLHKHKLNDDQLAIALAVDKEARRQKINPDFVWPMVYQESKFNPDLTSPKGAFGVMQLMEETAKGLKVDRKDIEQNIRGGISLLKELMSTEGIGNDPYKVLAGYNASTEARNKFFQSKNLDDLPDETLTHMYKVAKNFGGDLPDVNLVTQEEAGTQNTNKSSTTNPPPKPPEAPPDLELPRAIAGYIGAGAGATAGAGVGAGAAGLHMKTDVARILASYPEAMAALKSGKTPAEVIDMVLKGKGASANLPPAQGPLTGEPAGGRMTQNWVGSQDAQGRYTDVGISARDQAEAHQMKRAAMAAEDKIRSIAPEMRPDPNRANLFIPESAGKGPSPRFGGTPNVPIPPVASPVAEAPTLLGTVGNYAKGYLPYFKYPALGALTGANILQGGADVYNRIQNKLPEEATASGLSTVAGTVAPFVSGVANPLLGAGAIATQLALAAQDRERHLKKHPEDFILEDTDYDPMGNRIR